MKKYLIFIIIVLILLLTISGSIITNIVQHLRFVKLNVKYNNLLQDKNKIKQSEEKYMKEANEKEKILNELEIKLKELNNKGGTEDEKIKYYRNIISDNN